MPIRIFVLALLLLSLAPAASAAEPPRATVVLELPASMPPGEVRALIAELAAKGARPAMQPAADPATGAVPPALTSAGPAALVWAGTAKALLALGQSRRRGGRNRLAALCEEEMSEAIGRGWADRDASIFLTLQEERANVRVRLIEHSDLVKAIPLSPVGTQVSET